VLAGITLAWLWAASRRRAAHALFVREAAASAPASARPHVTCVLPVKGCTAVKVANWRSQLSSTYGGPLDFVFVVESSDDPAVRRLHRAPTRPSGAARS
jgi:hypothetical protein